MADEPPIAAEGGLRPNPQDAAYLALHAEREALERDLTLVQQQQRFGGNAAAVDQARLREAALLKDLDRVLTQIRAAEYRRRPDAKRW